MNTLRILMLCGLVFGLAACAAQPVTPVASSPAASSTDGVLKTDIGDLVYVSARLVDEVNGVTPVTGNKLVLVILERADQNDFDLQAFHDAHMQIYLQGDDGSNTLSTMAGFVGEEFAIGFQGPEAAKTYRLVWGENAPIDIEPGEK